MCNGDCKGRYTYISDNGCSVIDYFLLSSNFFALLNECCSLDIMENIDSYHLPVKLSIGFQDENESKNCGLNNGKCMNIEKMVWNPTNENIYKASLDSLEVQNKLDTAISLISSDVDKALKMFNECIKDASVCMRKKCLRVVVEKNKNGLIFNV